MYAVRRRPSEFRLAVEKQAWQLGSQLASAMAMVHVHLIRHRMPRCPQGLLQRSASTPSPSLAPSPRRHGGKEIRYRLDGPQVRPRRRARAAQATSRLSSVSGANGCLCQHRNGRLSRRKPAGTVETTGFSGSAPGYRLSRYATSNWMLSFRNCSTSFGSASAINRAIRSASGLRSDRSS